MFDFAWWISYRMPYWQLSWFVLKTYYLLTGNWYAWLPIKNKFIFPIKYFVKNWFYWKLCRIIKELWRYGYILSWDERTNIGIVMPRFWVHWRSEYRRYRYNKSIRGKYVKTRS